MPRLACSRLLNGCSLVPPFGRAGPHLLHSSAEPPENGSRSPLGCACAGSQHSVSLPGCCHGWEATWLCRQTATMEQSLWQWPTHTRTQTQNTVENVNDTISNAIVLGTWSVQKQTDSSNDHKQKCNLTIRSALNVLQYKISRNSSSRPGNNQPNPSPCIRLAIFCPGLAFFILWLAEQMVPPASLGGMTVQGAQDHMGLSGYCHAHCMGHRRWMREAREWSLSCKPQTGNLGNVWICKILPNNVHVSVYRPNERLGWKSSSHKPLFPLYFDPPVFFLFPHKSVLSMDAHNLITCNVSRTSITLGNNL